MDNHSSSSILKYFREKALKIDSYARFIQIDDVPKLVVYRTEALGVVTARLVEKNRKKMTRQQKMELKCLL